MKRSPIKRKTTLKPKARNPEQIEIDKQATEAQWKLFHEVWTERKHICYECSQYLGEECKSIYMDHILEKGNDKYKHLKYEKGNIELLCWYHHNQKTNGFASEKYKQLIEDTKKKYGV